MRNAPAPAPAGPSGGGGVGEAPAAGVPRSETPTSTVHTSLPSRRRIGRNGTRCTGPESRTGKPVEAGRADLPKTGLTRSSQKMSWIGSLAP